LADPADLVREVRRIGMSSLGEEFAIFADEASAWAELTLSAAFETWPDES
jgi:hypothetical protein